MPRRVSRSPFPPHLSSSTTSLAEECPASPWPGRTPAPPPVRARFTPITTTRSVLLHNKPLALELPQQCPPRRPLRPLRTVRRRQQRLRPPQPPCATRAAPLDLVSTTSSSCRRPSSNSWRSSNSSSCCSRHTSSTNSRHTYFSSSNNNSSPVHLMEWPTRRRWPRTPSPASSARERPPSMLAAHRPWLSVVSSPRLHLLPKLEVAPCSSFASRFWS